MKQCEAISENHDENLRVSTIHPIAAFQTLHSMDALGRGQFSTSSAAPAEIFGSA